MKRTSLILLIVLTLALLLETFSLAWVSDNGLSSIINVSGNVHKNYFAYGKGTEDEPYGIDNPVQLYYFSWLQYLGFFNNTDNDGDGYLDSFYFELADYIKDGKLDMTGYKLPPIGTTNNPFIGNFDGNGITISNLTVRNYYSQLSAPPSGTDDFGGAEIIGFFGVIGSLDSNSNNYNYHTQENEVKNLALENVTIITQTTQTLVGIVAGYVNGTVDCVGVIGGNVQILSNVTGALTDYTNNLSDYSLIGYCTTEYKNDLYVMDVTLSNPGISGIYNVVPDMTSDGEGHGWGGSVKMSDIYTWLTDVSEDRATTNGNYILERSDVISIDGKTVTANRENASKLNYSVENFGSFVITNSQPNYVNFISGGTKVTAIKYSYTENNVAVYYITDGTNYLCYNGTSITNTTNQANATTWYVSNGANGGNIYTVVDGTVYYLSIANNNITATHTVTPDNAPSWRVVNNDLRLDSQRIEVSNGTWRIAIPNTFLIASGSHYLSATRANNGTVSITDQSNANSATQWSMNLSGTSTTISTVINGTTYYLGRNGDGLSITTTQTNWTYDATNVRLSNGNRYLRYSGGWSTGSRATSTGTNLTLTGVWNENEINSKVAVQLSGTTGRQLSYSEEEYIDNSTQNRYYDENGNEVPTGAGITYFPLSTTVNVGNNSYSIASGNTGYIIGSEWGAIEKNEHDQYGNIRISRYNASDMNNTTMPLTMTYETIKTSTAFQPIDATPTAAHLATLGLQKYANCYLDFRSSVTNYCYGLHFMQSTVSASNVTQFDAYLNGGIKENYQMPTNCIDFNLYDRGFINFVAGSYFTGQGVNDSFFSIYEVVRDENENITEIKEIRKIYAYMKNGEIDTSQAYYYTYREGNNEVGTEGIPAGYEMAFDCHWITNPDSYSGWANNKAFYFEVPVNAGEYAIGSTEGRTGAYLVYLDLAANAQIIERQKDYEKIEEIQYKGSIPNGVELLAPGETLKNVDPSNSAFVSINKTGEITFSTADGETITHTAKDGTSVEYIGNGITLKDGYGNVMQMQSEKTVIEQTTYRDRNLNTGEYTVTVITKTTVGSNVTYARTITKGTWNSETNSPENMVLEESTEPQAGILGPKTADSEENQGGGAVGLDSLIKLYYSYGQKVNLTVKYEYTYSETNPTYNITVTNGGEKDVNVKAVLTSAGVNSDLTFYINGQVLNDTVDPQTVTVSGTPAES